MERGQAHPQTLLPFLQAQPILCGPPQAAGPHLLFGSDGGGNDRGEVVGKEEENPEDVRLPEEEGVGSPRYDAERNAHDGGPGGRVRADRRGDVEEDKRGEDGAEGDWLLRGRLPLLEEDVIAFAIIITRNSNEGQALGSIPCRESQRSSFRTAFPEAAAAEGKGATLATQRVEPEAEAEVQRPEETEGAPGRRA